MEKKVYTIFQISLTKDSSNDFETICSILWDRFTDEENGLLGIHEGTVLSDEAFEKGLETESFTVDAALAPKERDWIKEISEERILYFGTKEVAEKARELMMEFEGVIVSELLEQPVEDWDADWKASFMGMDVPPFWVVRPPWNLENIDPEKKCLQINPGAGFGTGTHETTQLCLEQMATLVKDGDRCFDFGSGSGILSIGAALLGAKVIGVEIDTLANDNARANTELNNANLKNKPVFFETLPKGLEPFDVVIANILRPVLIEFSDLLTHSLKKGGTLILSGLVENDLPEIRKVFTEKCGSSPLLEKGLNEWRCVVFKK